MVPAPVFNSAPTTGRAPLTGILAAFFTAFLATTFFALAPPPPPNIAGASETRTATTDVLIGAWQARCHPRACTPSTKAAAGASTSKSMAIRTPMASDDARSLRSFGACWRGGGRRFCLKLEGINLRDRLSLSQKDK